MPVDDVEGGERTSRGLSRRQMIKASAVAGAAAWTAPVIVDSLSSPAAAGSFPPCPDVGHHYVVLHSPTAGGGLQERPGSSWNDSYSAPSLYGGGNCPVGTPGGTCAPTAGNRVSALAIRLTTTNQNISHNVNVQQTGSVSLSLDPTSCCTITRVVAQVHRFGSPTGNSSSGDCPPDYCQVAGASTYLPASGLGTKNVMLNPSRTGNLCSGNQGIHWGSPNDVSSCNTTGGNGYTVGQPFGYLLIEVDCVQPH